MDKTVTSGNILDLQAAIDQVRDAGGGTIRISGEYSLTKPLYIGVEIYLRGIRLPYWAIWWRRVLGLS